MDASFENVGKILEKKFVECSEIPPERIGVCDELYLVPDRHDCLTSTFDSGVHCSDSFTLLEILLTAFSAGQPNPEMGHSIC